ncbi:MAG TPA: hypothetical protein VLY83_05525 [Methanoregula sp.]|nr:hypothetical protein [Methanoregula sp.]
MIDRERDRDQKISGAITTAIKNFQSRSVTRLKKSLPGLYEAGAVRCRTGKWCSPGDFPGSDRSRRAGAGADKNPPGPVHFSLWIFLIFGMDPGSGRVILETRPSNQTSSQISPYRAPFANPANPFFGPVEMVLTPDKNILIISRIRKISDLKGFRPANLAGF